MNALSQNTKITVFDINTLISECNGKLNLSGGTITGSINLNNVGIISGYSNDDYRVAQFTSDTNSGFYAISGSSNNQTGSFICRACVDGVTIHDLTGNVDGTLIWDGHNVITSKGGVITGNLKISGNLEANNIYCNRFNSSTTWGVGTTWNDAPSISLYGPDVTSGVPNGFVIRTGANSYSLVGQTNSLLTWGGKEVLTNPPTVSYIDFPQGRIWCNNSNDDKGIVIGGNPDWNNTGGILLRGGQSTIAPSSVYIHSKYGNELNELMLQPTYTQSNRPINIASGDYGKLRLLASGDYIDTNPSVSEIDNQVWFCDSQGVGQGVLQYIHRNSGQCDFFMTCRRSSTDSWKSLGLQLHTNNQAWMHTDAVGMTFGNGTQLWIA